MTVSSFVEGVIIIVIDYEKQVRRYEKKHIIDARVPWREKARRNDATSTT